MCAMLGPAVPDLLVLFLSINAPDVLEFAKFDENATFPSMRLGLASSKLKLTHGGGSWVKCWR